MRVFLNGEFLPKEEAKVSVQDRGFLFGDGVYEVIPVFKNKLFRFDEHMSRLDNSLSAINIKNPHYQADWKKICESVIIDNPGTADKTVYIQVTRGSGERDHVYKDDLVPTVFVMCNSASTMDYEKGVSAITHADIRWQQCDIKAITLLPNILLRQLALDTDGSYESILIRDGNVTEGAASNVFVVKNDKILTPPKDRNILAGITRDLLVDLLNKANLQCYEEVVSEDNLINADEIWLTGSRTGIAPVVKLNGKPVADGTPGELWKKANDIFNNYISDYKNS